MADDVCEIIAILARSMPDVPAETWSRMINELRRNFPGHRPYIAGHKKGRHLAILENNKDQDEEKVAKMLGVSVRRVQQLKKLI